MRESFALGGQDGRQPKHPEGNDDRRDRGGRCANSGLLLHLAGIAAGCGRNGTHGGVLYRRRVHTWRRVLLSSFATARVRVHKGGTGSQLAAPTFSLIQKILS